MNHPLKKALQYLLFTLPLLASANSYAQDHSSDPSCLNSDSTVTIYYDAIGKVLDPENRDTASYYREINYKEGMICWAVMDYYIDGTPYMKGYYKDNTIAPGYENGTFTYFYRNGTIFQTRQYSVGLLDGTFTEFYPSGLRKASVSFSKGIRQGCEIVWDEEGKVVRKVFNDKGVVNGQMECDTPSRSSKPISQKKVDYKDRYDAEFPDGEYTLWRDIFYCKTKGLDIITIKLVDDNNKVIPVERIRLGQQFYVLISVTGLKGNNGKYQYIMAQAQEDENGVNYGNSGDVNTESELATVWVNFGGGIKVLPSGVDSKTIYFSFKIKDRNSDAILHGYLKYDIKK